MIVNNKEKVIKVRLRRMALTIIFAVLISLVFTVRFFNSNPLGLSKQNWGLILLTIYILISLYYLLLNQCYILLKNEKEKLVLRYYSLRFFGGKKKSVVIPLSEFAGYKIESSKSGIRKELILLRKVNNGIAKYPPVSLTGLSESEINSVSQILSKISGHK